mgnify:CR=1 FL=1
MQCVDATVFQAGLREPNIYNRKQEARHREAGRESAQMNITTSLPVLLLVDDDPLIAETLAFVLRKHFDVLLADSAERAMALLRAAPVAWTYEEVDPDVFGEELESPAYSTADRIAAVVLTATRST